jgi:cysteinyl-tRNA synthetase
MSKSKGNIYYTDTLLEQGYDISEIRFFLIYGHYRENLDYSDEEMASAANKLRAFRKTVRNVEARIDQVNDLDGSVARGIKGIFVEEMDNDLHVMAAFDGLYGLLSEFEPAKLRPREASGIVKALREIDEVLRVIY